MRRENTWLVIWVEKQLVLILSLLLLEILNDFLSKWTLIVYNK
jgi:hypothetical protein